MVLTVPKQFQRLAVLGGVGVNLQKVPSSTASQELHKLPHFPCHRCCRRNRNLVCSQLSSLENGTFSSKIKTDRLDQLPITGIATAALRCCARWELNQRGGTGGSSEKPGITNCSGDGASGRNKGIFSPWKK